MPETVTIRGREFEATSTLAGAALGAYTVSIATGVWLRTEVDTCLRSLIRARRAAYGLCGVAPRDAERALIAAQEMVAEYWRSYGVTVSDTCVTAYGRPTNMQDVAITVDCLFEDLPRFADAAVQA